MKKNQNTFPLLLALKLISSSEKTAQGFSLGEVLIASIVSALFFLVALQSTFAGSNSQTQALTQSEFNNLIQAEIEPIRSRADQYNNSRLTNSVSTGSTSLNVTAATDFKNLNVSVPDTDTWIMIAGNNNDATITDPNKKDDTKLDTVAPSSTSTLRRYVYRLSVANTTTNVLTLQSSTPLAKGYTPSNSNPISVLKWGERVTTVYANAAINTRIIQLTDASALPLYSQIVIGDDTQVYTITEKSAPSGGSTQVKVSPALKTAKTANTVIGASPCSVLSAGSGFAQGLSQRALGVTVPTNTLSITEAINTTKTSANTQNQVSYKFQRTISIVNQIPFNVLRVTYVVKNPFRLEYSANDPTYTTDIVPKLALYCS